MDNLIPLFKPDPKIWVCNCGCNTFLLQDDGAAICANCDEYCDIGGWKVSSHGDNEFDGTSFRDVQGNGSVDFAKSRLERLSKDDDAAIVVVVKENGTVHAWSPLETRDQMRWVRRRLYEAYTLIKGLI